MKIRRNLQLQILPLIHTLCLIYIYTIVELLYDVGLTSEENCDTTVQHILQVYKQVLFTFMLFHGRAGGLATIRRIVPFSGTKLPLKTETELFL